jgi:MFS family permease
MYSRKSKILYFILEGLNSFAVTYFFAYFYFLMRDAHGFGTQANLALAALNGGVYAVFSYWAGKYGQRHGYFRALRLAFLIMMGALLCGLFIHSAAGHILIMVVAVIGMCFTWPALEALVSEGETRRGIQDMVGAYNIVWAGAAALSYFVGGALFEKLGRPGLFYVPVIVQAVQLGLTLYLARRFPERGVKPSQSGAASVGEVATPEVEALPQAPAGGAKFLRMAWVSNPFAYMAINTLVAAIPGITARFQLSTMLAGFCCSIWYFTRLGAFVGLWRWTGWHYRFRWLLGAFVALVVSFALILMVPSLAVLLLAQVLFGGALGLIYYSSLFYSMDQSDTKSEHGGIHEAAIGLGNCAGPAAGSLSLYLLPQYSNSGGLAVCGLLLIGLGGLVTIWWKHEPGSS